MSQPQPSIDANDVSDLSGFGGHSLAEVAVRNTFSNGVDAIEVGWIVWPCLRLITLDCPLPFLLDPYHPHLFVSRTVGAQTKCEQSSGHCYAWEANSDWVQVSNTPGHRPGDSVTVTDNPEQYGIYYYQGNWWVNYQNDWIGYFPASLWPKSRFTQITRADWYGEVSSKSSQGACTQMGNGTYGSKPNSAEITDMGFINFDESQTEANATRYATDPKYYDMGIFTGHSFTYGGPGKCAVVR
jgi:Arabidopsis proteins of unknown function.